MADQKGGTQMGGGPTQSDMAAPGGSSGTGGYGKDQQSANDQGQAQGAVGHDERQSRGERYDEEQGGGRGSDSISRDEIAQVGGSGGSFDQHTDDNPLTAAADALLQDQDRGQEAADFESDAES